MRVPNQYPIVSRVERWRVNLHTSIVHGSSVGLAGYGDSYDVCSIQQHTTQS